MEYEVKQRLIKFLTLVCHDSFHFDQQVNIKGLVEFEVDTSEVIKVSFIECIHASCKKSPTHTNNVCVERSINTTCPAGILAILDAVGETKPEANAEQTSQDENRSPNTLMNAEIKLEEDTNDEANSSADAFDIIINDQEVIRVIEGSDGDPKDLDYSPRSEEPDDVSVNDESEEDLEDDQDYSPGVGVPKDITSRGVVKPFICTICKKTFRTKSSMSNHMRAHSDKAGNKYFACTGCGKSYLSKRNLNRHVKTTKCKELHQDGDDAKTKAVLIQTYSCMICNEEMQSKYTLRQHLKTHKLDPPEGSDSTNNPHAAGETAHNSNNGMPPMPYSCIDCPYQTTNKTTLIKHMKAHLGDHVCDFCHTGFPDSTCLAEHTCSDSYTCDVCPVTFNKKLLLIIHKRVHSDSKPFKCQQCPEQFLSNISLITHSVRRHNSSDGYVCQVCGKSFYPKANLDSHVRHIHMGLKKMTKIFKCEQCAKEFSCFRNLESHMNRHAGIKPYACDICGKNFIGWPSFKKHQNRHTGKSIVQCELCPVKVAKGSIYKHMRTHTGEKPYPCTICNKSFSTPDYVQADTKYGIHLH